MKTNNQLDKVFGPVGSAAGIFLFAGGLVLTYFNLSGLLLILLGAFTGFSSTSTLVDFEKRRLRFSNNFFGIFPVGPWIYVKAEMTIGIKKSNVLWRAYSRSNRIHDIHNNDYRIVLFDPDGKEILPVKKFDNLESAQSNLESLGKQLGIGVIYK